MDTGTLLSLPDRQKPYVMAHRGNRVLCPENTLASFRRAIDDGADILETDLHLSADGAFMCIHDATVDRTTDGRGAVAGMTLAELKALSAAYGRPEFQAERIPTLPEVAAILPQDVALALELKTDRFLEPEVCRRLVAELDRAGVRDRTVALSFSLPRLRALQAIAASLPIGWITLSRAWPLRGVQMLGAFWPLLILNPAYVWLAHRRGVLVCPLDPAPDGRLWLYRLLRCDAVLTDDPAATIRALKRAPGREHPERRDAR
jgi:glycerophosphoryl diester phosphodiesterase